MAEHIAPGSENLTAAHACRAAGGPARSVVTALIIALAGSRLCRADEPILASQPDWTGPVESTVSVVLGDVDGDGDLDLVRGNGEQGATLYINTGRRFADVPVWSEPVQPIAGGDAILGDVDGDGDLDLVRGSSGSPAERIKVYLNIGGTFASSAHWTGPAESTTSLALGDVDGDGDLDLVRGNFVEGTTLYLNTGGTFTDTPAWTGPATHTTSVALGDVDGDGDVDLVLGNYGLGTGDGATLHLNTGGTFADTPAWTGSVEATQAVALGDVDRDGDLDLVRGNTGEGTTLYLNTGGTFADTPAWTGPLDYTESVALGDVDGDGDLDLIRGNGDTGATLQLNADGTFADAPAWVGQREYTASVALGDVDGNDQLDLVSGNIGEGATLYLNTAATFDDAPAWAGGVDEYTPGVALGDVDGDGDLDLVRGNADAGATLHLNIGGTFSDSPSWTGPLEYTVSVALGDVDGDGDLDLVRGNSGEAATLYLNAGSTFADAPAWAGPVENTRSVALGDVDGDGDLDLVRGNSSGGATLYLNTGATFADAPVWTGPDQPTSRVALGDVDGDGDLDLVAGNGSAGATLYLNIGGSFASSPAWTGPLESTDGVALADVDGDGDLDLVRANGNAGATLYLNIGGSFASSPAWTGPQEHTLSVALGDMDGDGDVDLIRGNAFDATTLYLNVGGTFAPRPAWTGSVDEPPSMALGDVDGDGDLDLVCGSFEGPRLYLNRTPWLLAGVPISRLPNNAAYLRWVRVSALEPNRYQISFQSFDVESDPLWVVGEYQLEGKPVWYPMDLDGTTLRAGPFTTSPSGVPHDVAWDVTRLPFDRRDFIIRLRAISPPRHVGIIQFVPSYLKRVGRVVPARPSVTASPGTLVFSSPVTVGDTAFAVLRISNPGTRDLVVDRIESPDPAVRVMADAGLVIPPGEGRSLDVILAPRSVIAGLGPIRIYGNDPTTPEIEIPLVSDIRSLEVTTQISTALPELPLGEAASVVVTPAAGVRMEAGMVYYRARGASPSFPDSAPLVPRGSSFFALIPGDAVTEAGLEYFVRVENSGIFATDPPGAPESSFFYPVSHPTRISALAEADASGDYPAGRPTPVVVSLLRGSRFGDGQLFYRAGGAAEYDSLELAIQEVAPGVFSPAASIPAEATGPRGLEYWARVRTLTEVLTDPAQDPADLPRIARVDVAGLQESETHAGSRYHMVSIPLDLSLPATGTLEALLSDQPEFGTYDPTRWRSYRYLVDARGYVELSPEAAANGQLRPEPGRAFWLIARNAHRVDTAPVPGRSPPTDAPYRITLEPGWNQVGDPFLFPVRWEEIRAEGPAGVVALEPPVAWDEGQGAYRDQDVELLLPFEGYWVWNPESEAVDLLVPPDEAGSFASTATMAESEPDDSTRWRLRIAASCGPARDGGNYAGIAALAREGRDPFDRTEPPMSPGPALSLYFVESETGDQGPLHRRAVDLKPPLPEEGDPAARGRRWVFDVVRNGDELPPEVRLDFVGIDRVPHHVEVRLIDRVLERSIDLRQRAEHRFAGARFGVVGRPSEARFELLVGTPEFLERARAGQAEHPRLTRLLPSFPNPVATAAVIRFETARAGRVSVSVFDVTGRRVRTLVDENRDAGLHELVWRGVDDEGRRLPPGVYSVRLVGPDRADVRKLVQIQ